MEKLANKQRMGPGGMNISNHEAGATRWRIAARLCTSIAIRTTFWARSGHEAEPAE
jgi:hypothetical protein